MAGSTDRHRLSYTAKGLEKDIFKTRQVTNCYCWLLFSLPVLYTLPPPKRPSHILSLQSIPLYICYFCPAIQTDKTSSSHCVVLCYNLTNKYCCRHLVPPTHCPNCLFNSFMQSLPLKFHLSHTVPLSPNSVPFVRFPFKQLHPSYWLTKYLREFSPPRIPLCNQCVGVDTRSEPRSVAAERPSH